MTDFIALTQKYAKHPVSQQQVRDVFYGMVRALAETMARGDSVSFAKFGTFGSKIQHAHGGRNRLTGEVFIVPPTRIIAFKPAQTFKKYFKYCRDNPDKVDTAKLL